VAELRPGQTKYTPPNKAYFLPEEKLAAQAKAQAAPAAGKEKRARGGLRRLGTIGIGVAVVLIVAFVAAVLALPGCVKSRVIEAAAERGVVVGIGDVRLGADRFTLVGVDATLSGVPGVKASAQEIEIDTSFLDPRLVTASKVDVTIDASFDATKAAFRAWRAKHAGAAGGAGPSRPLPKLVADVVHVVWNKPFGDGKIEAIDAHAEATQGDVHVMAPRVTLTVPSGTVGPWRIDYDQDDKSTRTRVAFDPLVPDGPKVLVVGDGQQTNLVDLDIARSPVSHLGVKVASFDKQLDTVQVQAKLQYQRTAPDLAEARATGGLYGLRFTGAPVAMDATMDVYVKGNPTPPKSVAGDTEERGGTLDVKKGELAIGPMKGAVTGTATLFEGGLRLDFAWHAAPMPCSVFFTPAVPPPGAPSDPIADLQRALGQLAQATGIAKVTGDIEASAELVLDTRDFAQTKLDFTPKQTCSLSLFGTP
jgi:hypothetical protein